MKILVVGRGWTGKKVYDVLLNRRHEVTLCSHIDTLSMLANGYDWVVNCAGATGVPNVDACEFKKTETLNGNAAFPIILQHMCQINGIRFAHFSSGCIYQGNIDDVNADPNFFGSVYSVSKGVSDTYLKDKAQVYRIRMPFTNIDEPKNYLSKVLKYATTGKLIEGGANSITDLDEAVSVACDLIETDAPNGPYNLVNSGSLTMHQLVDILNINVEWFTDEEFAAATVAKRSNCVIPAYEKMTPITDAIKNAITSMRK